MENVGEVSVENELEQKLIDAYMGEKADKLQTDNLNFAAAFLGELFGPVWFFAKKAYLLGFGYILLTIAVAIVAEIINFNEASYAMFFVYLLTANKAYLWDVKRKVKKLMNENQGAVEEELIEKAKKKGGISILATVLYCVCFMIFIIALFAFMFILLLVESSQVPINI